LKAATLLFVFHLAAFGAAKYVCDTPQENHSCNYPNSQLQSAFDQAAPGDTLYLQAGYTYLGAFIFHTNATAAQPITVTTSKPDWLPGPFTRISPSHLPNIPLLKTNVQNQPALSGNLDNSGLPPSNWHFVGLGFSVATPVEFDNSIIHTAGGGVNGWTIANAGQLPTGLVFDRILLQPPYDDSLVIQNGVQLNGQNTVFVNSFIWPIFCAGIECHALSTLTNPGPIVVENNFLSAASVPFFDGGTDPDYPGSSVPVNVTLQYNYLYRPLKWWGNSGSPDYAYFLQNGSKWACTKNLLELKAADQALVQFNVHENIWADNFCQGQYYGFSVTPRQSWWESPATGGYYGPSLGMNQLTASGTSFSWTGSANTLKPGQNICIEDYSSLPADQVAPIYDCHKIATVDNGAQQGSVITPFVLTAQNLATWLWVTDDTPLLRDVTMQNDVFRNVAGGFNMLGRDRGTATSGNEGRIIRLTIQNTLIENTIPALGNTPALQIIPQEVQFTVDPNVSGQNLNFEHNTFVSTNSFHNPIYFDADGMSQIAKIQNLTIQSNIFPDATLNSDGNIYALGGSGLGFNYWGIAETFASGALTFTNNQLWDVASICTIAICSNNYAGTYASTVQFEPGTFAIAPGTPLSGAGYQGTDVGVDYDQLPLISNLTVTSQASSASLGFDLAAPVQDAGATQPCVLEVSQSENLRSYLGPYMVIDDLNPAYFKQADASNRNNPLLLPVTTNGLPGPRRRQSHGHVTWPVGRNTVVMGDDGASHNLALTSNTQYWGRLMCYGDTQQFTFTSTSSDSSVVVTRP